MTSVLISHKEERTEVEWPQRQRLKRSGHKSRNDDSHQKLEEARGKEQFSPGALGESVALPGYSHQTCANLLQQPQEINIVTSSGVLRKFLQFMCKMGNLIVSTSQSCHEEQICIRTLFQVATNSPVNTALTSPLLVL